MLVADSWVFSMYVSMLGVLATFSVHRLFLARRAARSPTIPEPAAPAEHLWPTVLVQLPLYNEAAVAERVICAACSLDYPQEYLHIQVLDDSNDETVALVRAAVDGWARRGVHIEHVRRPQRQGYKAGALEHGLQCSDTEFVAVFDADFVPEPDFLRRLVPHFEDSRLGMVQARWGHLNRDENILTRAQAVLLDGHFVNEHGGRQASGAFFNFNGTAGVWRRRCIDDAGGWLARTLTEDLDLSYRAQNAGWKFVYRNDVVANAELPSTRAAFKTQQHRWAKGSGQCARLVLPALWKNKNICPRRMFEAAFHMLGNSAYVFLLLLVAMAPLALQLRMGVDWWPMAVLDGILCVVSTGGLAWFCFSSQPKDRPISARAWDIVLALALGAALAINNGVAWMSGILGHVSPFVRTPKKGNVLAPHEGVSRRMLIQCSAELAVGGYILFAVLLAISEGRYFAVPTLFILGSGFLFLGIDAFVGQARDTSSKHVISAGAKRRMGGPQKPVPRLT